MIVFIHLLLQENNHKLTSIMRPDKDYDEKLKSKEMDLLTAKVKDVDEKMNAEIHADGEIKALK